MTRHTRRLAASLRQKQYKGRNVVERCFNCLKQFRAIATLRKLAFRYQAGLHLASLILWLRDTTA